MEKKKIVLLSPFPCACTLRKNMVQKQLVNHKDSKEMRLWEAASKKVTGKSTMQTARHTSSCMIFENVSSREVQCFFNKSWVPELKALLNDTRGIWCQGQRGPAVGTEEAEKEDWGGKKLLQEEDWGQTAAEEYEWVCTGPENIFRYKKSNSRHSKNMAPRVISSLPPGGGGEKDDGRIISHHGHHLSPPAVPPRAQGSSLYGTQLHK